MNLVKVVWVKIFASMSCSFHQEILYVLTFSLFFVVLTQLSIIPYGISLYVKSCYNAHV